MSVLGYADEMEYLDESKFCYFLAVDDPDYLGIIFILEFEVHE